MLKVLRTKFDTKTKLLLLMPFILSPTYFLTNHMQVFEPHAIYPSAFDLMVPFVPSMSIVYLLLFPLMWAALLLQKDIQQSQRFLWQCFVCAIIAAIIFFVYPTTYFRPDIEHYTAEISRVYLAITSIDTHYNASPSLHGSYTLLSVLWLYKSYHTTGHMVILLSILCLIFFATIAIRQHGILDLAIGSLLAYVVYFIDNKRIVKDV